jgi:hypothetical protein
MPWHLGVRVQWWVLVIATAALRLSYLTCCGLIYDLLPTGTRTFSQILTWVTGNEGSPSVCREGFSIVNGNR